MLLDKEISGEQDKECSQEWLVSTDPGPRFTQDVQFWLFQFECCGATKGPLDYPIDKLILVEACQKHVTVSFVLMGSHYMYLKTLTFSFQRVTFRALLQDKNVCHD